jgi:predicted acylesterase/phospholipase RssA
MSEPTAPSPYASPTLECDVVMKGGITSGVIYPRAIASLAERYRLRNIGGASAGAIAAVAAGAAEYGRDAGDAARGIGFEGLSQLPAQLTEPVGPSGQPRLLSLFQPTEGARPAYRILLTVIGKLCAVRKILAVLGLVLGNVDSAAAAIAGAVAAAAAVVCAFLTGSAAAIVTAILGAMALFAVALTVAALLFVRDALQRLGPDNRYGMCSGFSEQAAVPALTQWLATSLNRLAGTVGAPPITFGTLATKGIALQLMTTDLTNGRPYGLPFGESDRGKYFFSDSAFRELFPGDVVDVMVKGAKALLEASRTATTERERRLYTVWSTAANRADKLPFPDGDALPLVVGARLSLSFPVLLQAVPLYAIDWTLKANQGGSPTFECCWFSDGGICSNLPIHFFDSLVPGRPTFALNLNGPHPDYPVRTPPFAPGQSERDNVWVPRNNTGGISESWNRFDQPPATVPLLSFLATMVDTMQCWNDNLIMHYPGYRDRVVHISHTDEEGGLNLDMPKETIDRLANRGATAGDVLRERFDPASGDGWTNHLWVRYRTLLAMLAEEAGALRRGVTGELQALFAAPPSYKLESKGQQQNADGVNRALLDLVNKLGAVPSVSDGAPNPRAVLKGRSRSG